MPKSGFPTGDLRLFLDFPEVRGIKILITSSSFYNWREEWSQWKNWDLRAHNLDIRDFRLIFWFCEFLFILRGNQSESESEKNRAIEWVMTHGFRNSGSKIIEIPLRFCRIWRFLNEIQNMSGNQVILRFFSKFSSKMMPFFINTFKTKLSEN